MTRALLVATVLPVLLVLTACGDDEDRGGDDPTSARSADAPDSPCGDLTDADVERLTGIAVTHEEKDLPAGLSTCTFNGADGASSSVVMVLVAPPGDTVEEIVEESQIGPDDQTTTEAVDVPGTDEAALVTDTSYGVTTTSVVATTSSAAYTLSASASTASAEGEVAVAALTILLGGTSDAPAAGRTEHPCDLLSAEEVSEVVGSRVTAERGELGSQGTDRCAYEGSDAGVGISMYALERTSPLETVVGLQEKTGSDVEEVDVEGLQAAYVVLDEELPDSAQVYLAAPGGTFVLDVRVVEGDQAAAIARDLLPLVAS